AGKEGIAYSLEIKGNPTEAFARVNNQEWVSSIQSHTENGRRRWLVSVTDASIAEEELLRLILRDKKVSVSDFKRREYELEEIFLNLVEENNNGN
ncbi:MAG: ABC transporter ATP-binding protein, partial [Candidatus Thorarchaeota archaeon]